MLVQSFLQDSQSSFINHNLIPLSNNNLGLLFIYDFLSLIESIDYGLVNWINLYLHIKITYSISQLTLIEPSLPFGYVDNLPQFVVSLGYLLPFQRLSTFHYRGGGLQPSPKMTLFEAATSLQRVKVRVTRSSSSSPVCMLMFLRLSNFGQERAVRVRSQIILVAPPIQQISAPSTSRPKNARRL